MSGVASRPPPSFTEQDRDRRDHDEVDRDHDGDHRDDEQEDQPARLPAGGGLPREEIHRRFSPPGGQVKLTFGTSRFCGDFDLEQLRRQEVERCRR